MNREPTSVDAPWRTAPATLKIMETLERARPGGSRFVGGCVRNTLMGRAVDDIDIATQLRPEEVIAAAEDVGITAIPTGVDHGTVTLVCDHQPFEITTLRRDVETDGRRAVVAYTDDWCEDSQRRDFRLNAIYMDVDGKVYDPTGGGLADAATGRIVFIGDADQRLREDYLRILRFFRFNAWYGAGIDEEGLAACERHRSGLGKIAAERIWKELARLLAAPQPAAVLRQTIKAGVLGEILPTAKNWRCVAGLERVEDLTAHAPDPLLRLICLLPVPSEDRAKALDDVNPVPEGLRLSNQQRDRLLDFAGRRVPYSRLEAGLSAKSARAVIYRLGARAFEDRMFYAWAGLSSATASDDEAYQGLLELVQTWSPPRFPLGGNDILKLGLHGKDVGIALAAAERDWVDSDFSLDSAALLRTVQDRRKRKP